MKEKSWIFLWIAVLVTLVVSYLSLGFVYYLARKTRHDQIIEKFKSDPPPDMKAFTTFKATFNSHTGEDRVTTAFLTFLPDSEDVYLVTFVKVTRETFGLQKEFTGPELAKNVKDIQMVPIKEGVKSYRLKNFQILCDAKNISRGNRTSLDLWLVKVPAYLKEWAMPLRLEPPKKNEPIWYFGSYLDREMILGVSVVKRIQENQIRVLFDPDSPGGYYSGTPFLDKHGYVVAFGFDWISMNQRVGFVNPSSIIQKRILNADF